MTLIPHHCCRTASEMPSNRTRRSLGLIRSLHSCTRPLLREVDPISTMTKAALDAPPMRVKMVVASAVRPRSANHLGLSGTTIMPKRKTAAGTAVTPNIHRHPACPFHEATISAGVVSAATGLAMSQFIVCAASSPSTIVSSLRHTSLPRIEAGDISAIYIGERLEESPIARPPVIRQRTKAVELQAMAVPHAEMRKTAAAICRERFRPNASLSTPDISAPTKQPIRAQLITQPCCAGVVKPKKAS